MLKVYSAMFRGLNFSFEGVGLDAIASTLFNIYIF
jgi:hypothetical protein